jgi:RNA polymerase sigma-70 factor (ECF subfamily)
VKRWSRRRKDNGHRVPEEASLPGNEVLSSLPDDELIVWPDRAAAFSALYSRYAPRILLYCRMRLSDPRDAEDLAASIFTSAWSAFPPDTRGPFRSWLFTIAHHAMGNHYRHQGARGPTRSLIDHDADAFRDPDQTPEMAVISKDDARELREALAHLGDDQRQVIELRLAGLKGREIAHILGRSEPAVKMLQYRAMQHLREVLSVTNADSTGRVKARKELADAC